jgi:hypothetical protein
MVDLIFTQVLCHKIGQVVVRTDFDQLDSTFFDLALDPGPVWRRALLFLGPRGKQYP